jgi:cell division septation protein DedD
LNSPVSKGLYLLQVAALTKQSDALALAKTLQKKGFPATVLSPQTDKFYRVQVGPYSDSKSADNAKKGLEDTGFKAIVKH